MKHIYLIGSLFIMGWMATVVNAAPSVNERLDSLEKALSAVMNRQTPRQLDGVVPERTPVYKTVSDCKEVKKTKLYFDGTHPFQILGEQRCGKSTYLVVRWFEKEFSDEIAINTVLKDDVILTPK